MSETHSELTTRETPAARDVHSWTVPAVDVYENDAELLLVADLPGVPADGLTVETRNQQIVVEGRRPAAEGRILWGAPSTAYRRVFAVPDFVDVAGVTAELKDGVLKVHLPKLPAVQPRRIAVRRE